MGIENGETMLKLTEAPQGTLPTRCEDTRRGLMRKHPLFAMLNYAVIRLLRTRNAMMRNRIKRVEGAIHKNTSASQNFWNVGPIGV